MYNPGIQDQQGAILAAAGPSISRNILAGGQALASGISGAGKSLATGLDSYLTKQYEGEAANDAAKWLAKTHPEALPPDRLDQFYSANTAGKQKILGQVYSDLLHSIRRADADKARQFEEQQKNIDRSLRSTFDTSSLPGGQTLVTNPGTGAAHVVDGPPPQIEVGTKRNGFTWDGGKWSRDPQQEPREATEADVAFDTNIQALTQSLDDMERVVSTFGNTETGPVLGVQAGPREVKDRAGKVVMGPDGKPLKMTAADAAAKLGALPYTIAVTTAKIMDPASVAREGEVDASKKYMLPAGFFSSNDTTLAAIDNYRKLIENYRNARSKAEGKEPSAAPSIPATAAGQAAGQPAARGQNGYIPGAKYGGRRYLGGDPMNPASWE